MFIYYITIIFTGLLSMALFNVEQIETRKNNFSESSQYEIPAPTNIQ